MNTKARKYGAMASSPLFLTLIITFILGFAIGFSLCYAWIMPQTKGATPVAADAPAELAEPAPADANDAASSLAGFDPGRHLILGVNGTTVDAPYAELLSRIRPAGVLFRPQNVESPEQSTRLAAEIKRASGFGEAASDFPLVAGDPVALGIASPPALAETAAARAVGRATAAACAAYGIYVAFAPSPALPAAPAGTETLAADTDARTAAVLAYTDGMVAGGVLPVLSGYPGEAPAEGAASLTQDVAGLAELLLPFTEALGHGVPGVRIEHVAVPALDIHYPDRPASLSPVLVRRLLRLDSAPYEGVIVAEDLVAPAVAARYTPEDAVVEALAAGCDVVILSEADPARVRSVCAAISRAVQDGLLLRERLEESQRRLQVWQDRIREPKPLDGPLPDVEPLRVAAAPAETQQPAETPAPAEAQPSQPAETPAPVEAQAPQPAEAPAPAAPEPAPEAKADEPAPPAEPAAEANPPEAQPPAETGPVADRSAQPDGTEKVYYTIQKGDRLFRIAQRFGVKPKDIIAWNNLPGEDIKWGTRLVIYTPNTEAPPQPGAGIAAAPAEAPAPAPPAEPAPAPAATEPPATPAEAAPEQAPPPPAAEAPAQGPAEAAAAPAEEAPPKTDEPAGVPTAAVRGTDGLVKIVYEVQRGDMLSRLCAQFDVKQSDVVKWNKLSNPNIQRGRRLTFYVDAETADRLGYTPDGQKKPAETPTT